MSLGSWNSKNKNSYILQGNSYISAAIQNLEENHLGLAKHLFEEADKKYQIAEDEKFAKKTGTKYL